MYLVVQLRSTVNVDGDVTDTLEMLNLHAMNHATLVPATDAYEGMLHKVANVTAWGEPSADVLATLLRRRAEPAAVPAGAANAAADAADATDASDETSDGIDDAWIADHTSHDDHTDHDDHHGGPPPGGWERRGWRGGESTWFMLGPILTAAGGALALGIAPATFLFLQIVQAVAANVGVIA